MSDESSLSTKVLTWLVAVLDRGGKVLVFGLTTTRVCCLAAEYVILLALEPLVMMFTFHIGVGSIG